MSATSLLAALAISQENFFILYFMSNPLGMAFNQYRFAAAESVEKAKAPKAISILMLAGIVSAFMGISSANYAKDLFIDYLYVGSYLALALFSFMPAIFFFFIKIMKKQK